LAALAVDLVAPGRCASVRVDDAQRAAPERLAEDAAALGGVAQDGVGWSMIAGAPTVQRPVEVSRERVGPHSWRVTLSDGSTEELISWDGCYRPAERAKREDQKPRKK
jgi:hypothetical protein